MKSMSDKTTKPFLALASVLIGAFIGIFSETALNIALPQLMRALELNTGTAQWLVTGYMLVIGIVLPFSSLLTKWFSTRKLVIFGLSDFIIGALISALAPNFIILLIGRILQGGATGILLPLMFTLALQLFPPEKLGSAMGICALVIMFAPAVGPTLTGLILGKLSWHWIFLSFLPFLAVALVIAYLYLPNIGQITRPKVDLLSLFSSIVGFSTLIAGVSFVTEFGWTSLQVILTLVIACLALCFYVYRQLHLETPVLNLQIFALKAFRTGTLLVMLDFAIVLSAMYLLPQYMQKGLLLPVALTGIVMLPGGVVNALMSAIAGRLYDRLGAKLLTRVGFVIALLGTVLFACTTTHSTIVYVITAHVILMIGCPLAMSPAQTYALNALSKEHYADGSTVMNTLQQIVGALATALTTSFLALGQKTYPGSDPAKAFTQGMHYGSYFTIGLVIIALLLSWTIKEQKHA